MISPGQVYNKLTVIEKSKDRKLKGRAYLWRCRCECGNIRYCRSERLRNGEERSCGCSNFIGIDHKNRKFKSPKEASMNGLVNRMKMSARHRGIEWDIAPDICKMLVMSNCYYCGQPPSNPYNVYQTKTGKKRSGQVDWIEEATVLCNGIDRVDSNLGYSAGNARPCCKTCNYAKSIMSETEFLKWILRVAAHLGLRLS